MPRLLAVTGPCALATSADAEAWCHDALARATRGLGPGDVVLGDGAAGPGAWAREAALFRGARSLEYRADGHRWVDGERSSTRWYPTRITQEILNNWHALRARTLADAAARAVAAGYAPSLARFRLPGAADHDEPLAAAWAARGLPLEEQVYDPAATRDATASLDGWDMVFIDLETGDTSATRAPILEIGAVHADRTGRRVLRRYEARLTVPPGFTCHPRALEKIHGYPARWHDARSVGVVLPEFLAWLPRRFVPANHNWPFDRRFVSAWTERLGLPAPGWHDDVDTLPTARTLLRDTGVAPNAQLGTLCAKLGIRLDAAHAALPDAEAARRLHVALVERAAEAACAPAAG